MTRYFLNKSPTKNVHRICPPDAIFKNVTMDHGLWTMDHSGDLLNV